MTNLEKFSKLLNSSVSAKLTGVPLKKSGKILKFEVVITPKTGFKNSICRYFKTYENAKKFCNSFGI